MVHSFVACHTRAIAGLTVVGYRAVAVGRFAGAEAVAFEFVVVVVGRERSVVGS